MHCSTKIHEISRFLNTPELSFSLTIRLQISTSKTRPSSLQMNHGLPHHSHTASLARSSLSSSQLSDIASSTVSSLSSKTWLVRRATGSCGPNDNSAECETPVHTNVIAIVLGIVIPLVGAIVVLTFLHFRHVKKLKKENEDSKDIDVDNDDFDPREFAGMAAKSNGYPPQFNSPGLHSTTSFDSEVSSFQKPSNTNGQNPFQTPYQLPQLSSSQRSLNNYDVFDKTAYPPSGAIYDSPKYPSSLHTHSRPSSPGSIVSNPYSDSHQIPYGLNPSQQALNPSSTSLASPTVSSRAPLSSLPRLDTTAPPRNISRVSSRISVVSSRTPVVETVSKDLSPLPTSAVVGNYEYGSVSTSNTLNDSESGTSIMRQDTETTIPDSDDDETRHKRIEQKIDTEIRAIETGLPNNKDLEVPSTTTGSGGLNRAMTKRTADFERVKSVYNEYFSPDTEAGHNKPQNFEISQEEKISSNQDRAVNQQHTQYGTAYDSAKSYQQHGHYDQNNSNSGTNNDNIDRLAASSDSYDQFNSNNATDNTHNYSSDYSDKNSQQNQYSIHGTNNDNYSDASYPVNNNYHSPDYNSQDVAQHEDFNHGYRSHHYSSDSPVSSSSPHTYTEDHSDPQMAPQVSISQQSFRSIQQLPQLSALPTPHKIEETDSSIMFAPQRRNNGPIPSNIAVYNPLDNLSSLEDKTLASPSQMRQSVAMISPGGFLPPKKYTPTAMDSDEVSSLRSFPTRTTRGQRPSSELVPDAKTQLEKLKPSMNMVVA